jgi:hypothetical protein
MTLYIISLGAGVQSTTMALMAARGEITPMPDCAIFADTGWEPKAVYQHLDRLERALPFPVYRVSAGNIRTDAIAGISKRTGKPFASIPWFIRNANGTNGLGRRQCTAHYKLEPIKAKIVELNAGKRLKGGTVLWIGISTDEALRMKPSRVQYITNRWPLVDRGMNRHDCRAWLARHSWDVPRSACIGCPFHSDEEWRSLVPDELADAVLVDEAIRDQPGLKGRQFAHRSRIPLAQVDFRSPAAIGQADLFNEECEGMCGV